MKTESTPQPEGSGAAVCSALDLAFALLDCGPKRKSDPQKWTDAAYALSEHCRDGEDVSETAMRILGAAYRNTLQALQDPVSVHINMLRGTIAWTPGGLLHVLGDSFQPNS